MGVGWRKTIWALGVGAILHAIIRGLAMSGWSWPDSTSGERQALAEIYSTLAALAGRLAALDRDLATLPGTTVQTHAAPLIQLLQAAHQTLRATQATLPVTQSQEPGAPLPTLGRELLHSLRVQAAALSQQVDEIEVIARDLLTTSAYSPVLLQRLAAAFDELYLHIEEMRRNRIALQEVYGAAVFERVRDNDILAEKRMAQARGMFDALSQQITNQTYEQVETTVRRIDQQLADAHRLVAVLHERIIYLRGTLAMDVAQLLSSLERVLTPLAGAPAPTIPGEIETLRLALERGQAIADELALPSPDLETVRNEFVALRALATALSPHQSALAAPNREALIESLMRLRRAAEALATLAAHRARSKEIGELAIATDMSSVVAGTDTGMALKERKTIPVIETVSPESALPPIAPAEGCGPEAVM